MHIITGNSHPVLFKELCLSLNLSPLKAQITSADDQEIRIKVLGSVERQEILVVQSICNPVNNNLMELLLLIDALKKVSASKINLLIPYFGYSRQDKKTPNCPAIVAKLIANLIAVVGASSVTTVDLHSPQLEGFFDIPINNLSTMQIFAKDISEKFNKDKIVIVSPDFGGIKRARDLADFLKVELVILEKSRINSSQVEIKHALGNIHGKVCILLDDLVDTANTLTQASLFLKQAGGKSIHAYVTHGVFSLGAMEKIERSPIINCTITNTIPFIMHNKLRILSIIPLLKAAIGGTKLD